MALGSQDTGTHSRLRVLAEREAMMPPPQLSFPSLADDHQSGRTPTPSEATLTQSPRVYPEAVLATFDVISRVLAARVILLLSVSGSFVLAWMAMQNPTNLAIIIAAVYNVTIVAPLVWLTAMRV